MKKYILTFLLIGAFSMGFARVIKSVEVSIKEFRQIRKDLEKKKMAYYIDAGVIHEESFGKSPKEIVTYIAIDENGLRCELTTGSRP